MMTMPPRLQIQTQTGCNGKCIFCPNTDFNRSALSMGKMSMELFQKIIDELTDNPPERIMPYLQNESLLDPRLPEFVQYTAEQLPEVETLITTNGTRLTRDMGQRLIDAGLKRIKVSLQSLNDAVNRRIMGYPATPVVENILNFQKLLEKTGAHIDLRVSMVINTENVTEQAYARRFWKQHGIRLVTSALENRGGNIANAETLNLGKSMVHCNDCVRPSRDMCILFDGRVVACCVDWFRTTIVGDLRTQSIAEVWNGEPYQRIRQGLATDDAQLLPEICQNCTESECPNQHRHASGAWEQFKHSLLGPFLGTRT